jgi:hypothetical protein
MGLVEDLRQLQPDTKPDLVSSLRSLQPDKPKRVAAGADIPAAMKTRIQKLITEKAYKPGTAQIDPGGMQNVLLMLPKKYHKYAQEYVKGSLKEPGATVETAVKSVGEHVVKPAVAFPIQAVNTVTSALAGHELSLLPLPKDKRTNNFANQTRAMSLSQAAKMPVDMVKFGVESIKNAPKDIATGNIGPIIGTGLMVAGGVHGAKKLKGKVTPKATPKAKANPTEVVESLRSLEPDVVSPATPGPVRVEAEVPITLDEAPQSPPQSFSKAQPSPVVAPEVAPVAPTPEPVSVFARVDKNNLDARGKATTDRIAEINANAPGPLETIPKTLPELEARKVELEGRIRILKDSPIAGYAQKELDRVNRAIEGMQGEAGVVGRFHGTSQPITDLGMTFDRYQSQNLYGPGFYTTDDFGVAGSYTGKGKGQAPTVYNVEWAGDKAPNLIDLEKPMPDDALLAMQEAVGDYTTLERSKPGKELYSDIKEALRDEGVSRMEAEEVLDSIRYALSQKGYDGFKHIGGQKTGGKPHNVEIYFSPVDDFTGKPKVKITEVGKGSEVAPVASKQPEGTITQPAPVNASESSPVKAGEVLETAPNAEPTAKPEAPKPDPLADATGGRVTGIKNAVTEAEESLYGLDPAEREAVKTNKDSFDRARAVYEADHDYGRKLTEDIISNPRQVTPDEIHALDIDRARIENDYHKATTQAAKDKALAELQRNQQAAAHAKQHNAAGFAAFKSMVKEDYSLASVILNADAKKKAKTGQGLTPEETAKIKAEVEKYESLKAEFDSYRTEVEAEVTRLKKLADSDNANVEVNKSIKRLKSIDDRIADIEAKMTDAMGAGKIPDDLTAEWNRLQEEKQMAEHAVSSAQEAAFRDTADQATGEAYTNHYARILEVDTEKGIRQGTRKVKKNGIVGDEVDEWYVSELTPEGMDPQAFAQEINRAIHGKKETTFLTGSGPRAWGEIADTITRDELIAFRQVLKGRGAKLTNAPKSAKARAVRSRTKRSYNPGDIHYGTTNRLVSKQRAGELEASINSKLAGMHSTPLRIDVVAEVAEYMLYHLEASARWSYKSLHKHIKNKFPNLRDNEIREAYSQAANDKRLERSRKITEAALSEVEAATKNKERIPKAPPIKLDAETIALKEQLRKARAEYDKVVQQEKANPKDTRLKAARTRLEREIVTLNEHIKNKTPIEKPKPVTYDAATQKLADEAKQLRAKLAELTAQPVPADVVLARKQKAQKTALEGRISRLEKHIESKTPMSKPAPVPATSEITNLRAQAKQLKAKLDDLTKQEPSADAVMAKRLARSKEALKRRLNVINSHIARKSAIEKVSPLEYDLEYLDLKAQVSKQKAILDEIVGPPETLGHKVRRVVAGVLNAPTGILAAWDDSFIGRQGGAMLFRNPKAWALGAKRSLKALGSEKASWEIDTAIRHDPHFALAQKSKLEYTALDPNAKLSAAEETSMYLRSAGKVPGLGKALRPFDRAYTTAANVMRHEAFYRMADVMGGSWTPEHYKSYASFLNKLTGRGELGRLAAYQPELSGLFVSARKIAADVQILFTPLSGPKEVRVAAAKTLVGYTSALMTLAYTVNASGMGKVETNPNSPDFMKMRIGNTRFDLTGGRAQVVRTMWRMGRATLKHSRYGDAKYTEKTATDHALQFLSNKQSPGIGAAKGLITGKDFKGDEITPGQVAGDLVTPWNAGEIAAAWQDEGPAMAAIVGISGFFGIGSQTYREKK